MHPDNTESALGLPYTVDTRGCTWITDATRFRVRMCGDTPAWVGCSWCSTHLRLVSPRAAAQLERKAAA